VLKEDSYFPMTSLRNLYLSVLLFLFFLPAAFKKCRLVGRKNSFYATGALGFHWFFLPR